MRKILLTLAALAAFGLALPAASDSASAETIIIKKGHRDHGWRHHNRDRIVVRQKHRHRDRVIVREGRRDHHGVGVVIR